MIDEQTLKDWEAVLLEWKNEIGGPYIDTPTIDIGLALIEETRRLESSNLNWANNSVKYEEELREAEKGIKYWMNACNEQAVALRESQAELQAAKELLEEKDRYLRSASNCIHQLTCDDMDLTRPCSQDCRDMTEAIALTEQLK